MAMSVWLKLKDRVEKQAGKRKEDQDSDGEDGGPPKAKRQKPDTDRDLDQDPNATLTMSTFKAAMRSMAEGTSDEKGVPCAMCHLSYCPIEGAKAALL